MALDKVLKVYDDNGNEIDYDILAKDVKFLPDGKDLPTKLAELEDEIGQGGYAPPPGGIPKSDLAQSVQDSLDKADSALQDEDVAEVAKTGDYNDLEHKPTIPDTSGLATKTELNAKQDKLSAGNGIVIAQDGKTVSVAEAIRTGAGKGATAVQSVTVESEEDGTVDIHVDDDTYSINLNHTHEEMAKLVVDTAANLPDVSEMERDTIYGEVADGEIATIYLGGYPFYGGGGASSGPVLRRPVDGATIDMGQTTSGTVSKAINVKGKSLTQALTIQLSGTGYSFGTTQPSGVTRDSATQLTVTAAAANALNGVDIVVVYTGSDSDKNVEVALGISSAAPDNISVEATLVANVYVYEDLAGVKFTGTQWLQTDYCPNPNTEFEMRCHFIENSNSAMQDLNNNKGYILRCAPNTGDGKAFSVYQMAPKSDAPNNSYGAGIINESSITYNGNYQIEVFHENKTLFTTDNIKMFYRNKTSNGEFGFNIGGTEYKVNTSKKSSAMETPMYIGKANDGTLYCRFDLVIYELKITENGEVVRDWVPKEKYGVPGLLDIAANGTGTFLSSETAKTSGLASDELVAIPLT